jgi:hypothetical protein
MVMVLKHVGSPVFLTGLSRAQALRTGSLLKSSYEPVSAYRFPISIFSKDLVLAYRDCYQQAGAFDLFHVGNAAGLVSVETPQDLPGGTDDADIAVVAADEQAVGTGAHG